MNRTMTRAILCSCIILLCTCTFLLCSCTIEKAQPAGPSSDNFDRAELGAVWKQTGPGYRIVNGELVVDHAFNHPLWLQRPIPRDCIVELDVWSNDDAGDIKLELWGDGHSFATTASYTATSYVFIFGGWGNTISAVARMNEHGADRKTRTDLKVQKGKKYHFRIERRGGHIDWQIDGQPFIAYDDAHPLEGPAHAYLGLNDWQAELHVDNLTVTPL
jgi:Farnesoic acid 0-methyl transferase